MTDVVIQQHSRKLLMMDILMSETCWAHKKWNKTASDIKLVFHSSTIAMMNGPINTRLRKAYFRIKDNSFVLNCNKLNSSISVKVFKKFQRNFLKFKNNLTQFSNFKVYLLFLLWSLPPFRHLTLPHQSEFLVLYKALEDIQVTSPTKEVMKRWNLKTSRHTFDVWRNTELQWVTSFSLQHCHSLWTEANILLILSACLCKLSGDGN